MRGSHDPLITWRTWVYVANWKNIFIFTKFISTKLDRKLTSGKRFRTFEPTSCFLFFLLAVVLGRTGNFFCIFHHSLLRAHVTRIGMFSLDTLGNIFVKVFSKVSMTCHMLKKKKLMAELSTHVESCFLATKTYHHYYNANEYQSCQGHDSYVTWPFNHVVL